jgi:hypothetical protein
LVSIMRRLRLLLPALLVIASATGSPARGQDGLASIVRKASIGRSDRATIRSEVVQRVNQLQKANLDPDRRASARERLIQTDQTKGISAAGRDVYAQVCSEELAGLTTHARWQTGFDALDVLIALDNAYTASALAAGLQSRHEVNRYRAAFGLHQLHSKLGADSDRRLILRALADAGEVETQEIVLRRIYQAIDFRAAATDGELADTCAGALDRVLSSRLAQLRKGKRNEAADALGYTAAARCYASAGASMQRLLISHMRGFLGHAADRYFAADTARTYRGTLTGVIRQCEDVIHGMIQASNQRVPGSRVGEAFKRGSKQRKQRNAGAALASLDVVLGGKPWHLP